MSSNGLQNPVEIEPLEGDGIDNTGAFPLDASATTTNLGSHATFQVATNQDPAENHIGDAIPVQTCSSARSDSDNSRVPSLWPGEIVTIEGLLTSIRQGGMVRLTSLPTADRRRSRPNSLPTNLIDVGTAKSSNNDADVTIGIGPRVIHTNLSLHKPSTPFESLLTTLFVKTDKPGDKPGNSVIGDCVISWKPSVVPQLFEFKYWFKRFKRKCVFLVQDHHLRRESPVSV